MLQTDAHVDTQIYACVHTCLCPTCLLTCMHTQMHLYIRTCMHKCMRHVHPHHTHGHKHTQVRTCTDTHTQCNPMLFQQTIRSCIPTCALVLADRCVSVHVEVQCTSPVQPTPRLLETTAAQQVKVPQRLKRQAMINSTCQGYNVNMRSPFDGILAHW